MVGSGEGVTGLGVPSSWFSMWPRLQSEYKIRDQFLEAFSFYSKELSSAYDTVFFSCCLIYTSAFSPQSKFFELLK